MKTTLPLTSVLLTAVLVFSCKKDPLPEPHPEQSFEGVLKSGGDFAPVVNKKALVNSQTTSLPMDSGDWVCTTNTYDILQGDPDFPLYDPNVSVIYPGSLLQGATLGKATPDIIAVKRSAGDISIDLINGSWAVNAHVNEVKKSTISQALNDIISSNNEELPARFNFGYTQVHNNEELALELGVDIDIFGITAAGQLTTTDKDEYNHYLVTLKQTFYTMSFDIPSSYDELFDPLVKPADLAKYVYAGNPATYVSDVTYGRVFYLLLESTSSTAQIEGAINGSFAGLPIGANADINYLSQLDSVGLRVLAIGGSVNSTFAAINETQLNDLTYMLGQSADIKTGVPLSYVVRTVYDNKLVYNKLATQFDVTDCELVP